MSLGREQELRPLRPAGYAYPSPPIKEAAIDRISMMGCFC